MKAYPIELDKPRTLRFTIDEVEALETRLGVGLDQLWQNKQRIVALVALLYHGLRHEDPTLTEKRIKRILQSVSTGVGTSRPSTRPCSRRSSPRGCTAA